MTQHRGVFLVLAGEVFLVMLGLGLVTPVMPLYARDFGIGATGVGSLVTVFGIARLIANVPAGHWTDRFGRRALLVAGPLLSSVGSFGFALAGSYAELLAWRVVQGVGSAVITTAAMVMLADISTPENRGRVMSLYQGSLLLGVGFGPAIGGLLADAFGVRAPFLAFGVLTALAALWAAARLPETRPTLLPQGDDAPPPPGLGEVLAKASRNRDFLLVSALTAGIFFTRAGGQMTLLPLFGEARLGLSESTIGFAFSVVAGCNFLALYAAGALSDRFGRKAVIVPSGFAAALGIWAFVWAESTAAFFAVAVLFGLGTGLAGPAPAAYATEIAPPDAVGPTMGLYRTLSDLGLVVGPVLLGAVVDGFGYTEAFAGNALLLLVTTALFAWFAHETAGPRRASRYAER